MDGTAGRRTESQGRLIPKMPVPQWVLSCRSRGACYGRNPLVET